MTPVRSPHLTSPILNPHLSLSAPDTALSSLRGWERGLNPWPCIELSSLGNLGSALPAWHAESLLLCYYQLSVITPLCTGKSALIFTDPSWINAFKNLRHLLLKSKSMHFMFWHGSIDPAGGRGKRGGGWVRMTVLSFLCLSVSVLFVSGFSVCLSFTFSPPPTSPCLVMLPSLMAFSCWFFWCPQCSSRLLNSDQYLHPPICPLINYGCSSHITYKISIVFVNGWSIFHLRSSSKLLSPLLALRLSSLLPSRFVSVLVYVCLWFMSFF